MFVYMWLVYSTKKWGVEGDGSWSESGVDSLVARLILEK